MGHQELLNQLIEIKSYSGEEQDLRNFIQGWFHEKGMEAFVQGNNLILHLEGQDRTRAFIFNSHMDTVSAGDESKWTYGPWTPTTNGDKLIGLGASDMKSGLAASMLLAENFANNGKPPVDMFFTYVEKEEQDGSGTQAFSEWFNTEGYVDRYTDLAGIFTEPTELTEIEHGHRGNIFIQVETSGDSGHSSRPRDLSEHAVRNMIHFSDELQHAMEIWREEFPSEVFEPPTVGEMTSIQAGVQSKDGQIVVQSPNKFPADCVATFDIRTTPDFHQVAMEKIVELGKKSGAKVSYAFPPAPAGYTDPNEKIVKIAQSVIPDNKLVVSQGSADLGFLTSYGVKAIILGPGEKSMMHKVDEYCHPSQIPQAVDIYKAIVESWAK